MPELKKFISESKTNNTDQSALLTNKKRPFQIPWARLWAIQVLLGKGDRGGVWLPFCGKMLRAEDRTGFPTNYRERKRERKVLFNNSQLKN